MMLCFREPALCNDSQFDDSDKRRVRPSWWTNYRTLLVEVIRSTVLVFFFFFMAISWLCEEIWRKKRNTHRHISQQTTHLPTVCTDSEWTSVH